MAQSIQVIHQIFKNILLFIYGLPIIFKMIISIIGTVVILYFLYKVIKRKQLDLIDYIYTTVIIIASVIQYNIFIGLSIIIIITLITMSPFFIVQSISKIIKNKNNNKK